MGVISLGGYNLKGYLETLHKDFADIIKGTKRRYHLSIDSGYNEQVNNHLRKILLPFFV